jgi:hypothetical protein
VKISQALRRREQAALDALKVTGKIFVEQYATLVEVVQERRDVFGGVTDDPDLRPLLDPSVTRSAVELLAHLTLPPAAKVEPSIVPAPPAAGGVVPVRRSDPEWSARQRVGVGG